MGAPRPACVSGGAEWGVEWPTDLRVDRRVAARRARPRLVPGRRDRRGESRARGTGLRAARAGHPAPGRQPLGASRSRCSPARWRGRGSPRSACSRRSTATLCASSYPGTGRFCRPRRRGASARRTCAISSSWRPPRARPLAARSARAMRSCTSTRSSRRGPTRPTSRSTASTAATRASRCASRASSCRPSQAAGAAIEGAAATRRAV